MAQTLILRYSYLLKSEIQQRAKIVFQHLVPVQCSVMYMYSIQLTMQQQCERRAIVVVKRSHHVDQGYRLYVAT